LPREKFEVFKLEAATLDNYGKVLNQNYELIGSFPHPYVMKEREIEWAEGLEVIYHKPKAATEARGRFSCFLLRSEV
jgi:hypothetical protein